MRALLTQGSPLAELHPIIFSVNALLASWPSLVTQPWLFPSPLHLWRLAQEPCVGGEGRSASGWWLPPEIAGSQEEEHLNFFSPVL